MTWLIKIEKALFYFFTFAFFWQLRLVWQPFGGAFNEWASVYLYATDIIIVAILFLWAVRILKDGIKIKCGRPEIFLSVFLMIVGASVVFAQNKLLAGYGFLKLLEMSALFLYVKHNFSVLYGLKSFWRWFIAGAALNSAVAINQFFAQKSLGLKIFAESPLASNIDGVAKIIVNGAKIMRAYGLVPHPNILAAILMAAIFGMAWLWLKQYNECHHGSSSGSRSWIPVFTGMTKRADCFLSASIFIFLLSALFFTFSRGVTIVGFAALAAWLIFVWLKNKEYRKPILGIFLLFAICYSLLAIICRPYVSARYDAGALSGSQAVNLRYFYNQEALTMIEKNPFLGVGQGNFVWALTRSDIANFEPWMAQPVHNIYLLIASETGPLGLLAFLLFLFFTIRAAWKYRHNLSESHLLFIVGALLLIGLFDHFLWDLQQGQILFWLVLGILASFSLNDQVESSPRS
ncbi:MAG: O-antigen ligase family protein [Candidatus Portnoybacteria bacterium]|nr:O-antigen ligase family protein [Candidatus Portnoybacteria bacterium]MDD4982671.1 O-antigen ligase family protein [Candidatus Portnoybacteria bacterium]